MHNNSKQKPIDTFQKEKQDFLSKFDKSKKGSVDSKIQGLVALINDSENYYTTSTCAGRIVLFSPHDSGKKSQFEWLWVTHDVLSAKKYPIIKKTIQNAKESNIWIAIEPVIMHVSANNLHNAKNLLSVARDLGFKRSGIIAERPNKVTIQLNSTESLQTIVKQGKFMIDDVYLKIIIKECNKKLKKTWKKIHLLETHFKKMIKIKKN